MNLATLPMAYTGEQPSIQGTVNGSPVTMIFDREGEGNVGVYHKTEKSYRKFCRTCGGHLLTDHPLWGVVDVYAATIPTYRHEPKLHVNYAETILRIKDGLAKMKDMPKEMGGSGDTLAE